MKKSRLILIACLTLSVTLMGQTIKKAPGLNRSIIKLYDIKNIRVVSQSPCKINFAISYFISPRVSDPCYIAVYAPTQAGMGQFSYLPAGRLPDGVAKGEVGFDRNVIVEVNYIGTAPVTTRTVEVVIYRHEGNLFKKIFPLQKTWKRFEIQGMKRIYTSSNHVKVQLQYFIDPTYTNPCFISAGVPSNSAPHSGFGYIPAGRLPSGIPKGQKHFTDNIVTEILYTGAAPYTSSTIELILYTTSHVHLNQSLLSWGQTWDARVH